MVKHPITKPYRGVGNRKRSRIDDVSNGRAIVGGTASELAVRVRSAVIPEEFNVLLNPRHRHYGELVWTDPQRFHFDPRLFTFEPQLE